MNTYYLIMPSNKDYSESELYNDPKDVFAEKYYFCSSIEKYKEIAFQITVPFQVSLHDTLSLNNKLMHQIYEKYTKAGFEVNDMLEEMVTCPEDYIKNCSFNTSVISIFHDVCDNYCKTYLVLI